MKLLNLLLVFVLAFSYLQAQQSEGTLDDSQAPSTVDKEYLEKLEIGQIDPAVPINVNVKCIEFFERLAVNQVDSAYSELLADSPINLNKEKYTITYKLQF